MDYILHFFSVLSSVGIIGAIIWSGRQWFAEKIKGEIRKDIESELGDRAAERQYRWAAKQRLYSAIGPLRFQLLLSCQDACDHIASHALTRPSYSLASNNYYGQSTLYRLLRPMVITELIERQIAFADFSVDPDAINILRFKKAAFGAFKGEQVILNHPNADWDRQVEHVYHHSLTNAACALIIENEKTDSIPMNFQEFQDFLKHKSNLNKISPFPKMIESFKIDEMPIFWIRLVAFCYLCARFVESHKANLPIESRVVDVKTLLRVAPDEFIVRNLDQFPAAFERIWAAGI